MALWAAGEDHVGQAGVTVSAPSRNGLRSCPVPDQVGFSAAVAAPTSKVLTQLSQYRRAPSPLVGSL